MSAYRDPGRREPPRREPGNALALALIIAFVCIVGAAVAVALARRAQESSAPTSPVVAHDEPDVEPLDAAQMEETLEHLAQMIATMDIAEATTNLEHSASTDEAMKLAEELRHDAARGDCLAVRAEFPRLIRASGAKVPLPDADDDAAPNDVAGQLAKIGAALDVLCPSDAAP